MLVSPWISANSQSTRLLTLPLLIPLVPLLHLWTLFLETLADGAAFRGPVLIDLSRAVGGKWGDRPEW